MTRRRPAVPERPPDDDAARRPVLGVPAARAPLTAGAPALAPGPRAGTPRSAPESAPGAPRQAERTRPHPLVQRLHGAVQRDDLRQAEALARVLLSEGCPLPSLFDDVLLPLLARLETATPASTSDGRRARLLLTALVSRLRGGAVLRDHAGTLALAGEPRAFLETYMLGTVMELRGWQTIALGALCPQDVDDLATAPAAPSVVVVGVDGASAASLREFCRRVRTRLPGAVLLAHGGDAATGRSAGADACSGSVGEAARLVGRLAAPLSDRELAILTHVARGLTNKQVAALLSVAPSTVKSHLDRVFDKLGCPDRAAAVAQAVRAGWIS